MGKFVTPKVFLVGFTNANLVGVREYLKYTGQESFMEEITQAGNNGLCLAECLTSLFAKMCYKTVVTGKNSNVEKTRSIENNLKATYDAAHGSVFEHVGFNFIVTDCSRVFTHELVRHRVGTAFSQTSGRYCRLDSIDMILDPILDDCKDLAEELLRKMEDTIYLMECKVGLRRPPDPNEHTKELGKVEPELCLHLRDKSIKTNNGQLQEISDAVRWVTAGVNQHTNFDQRKKLTSAIRRFAPNGQSNEIAFSVNLRALRHLVQMRTAPSAEWEMRFIMAQVYNIIANRYPLMFYKAKVKMVNDLPHVYGMRLQPYETDSSDPKSLALYPTDMLSREIFDRTSNTERKDE